MKATIKKIASDAKKRLQSGYWEELYKSREEDIICAKENGVSEDFVHGVYKTRHVSAKSAESKGEIYSMVREIIERERAGETVLNPIGLLMDETLFESLDDKGRQKYIFDLSRDYLEIKREIEAELKLKSLKG